jgi:hypothetical protein
MTEARNGGFQVHVSQAVAIQLRQLHRRAIARGQGNAFISALKSLVHALQTRPHTTGEPLYELPNLRLQVRTAALGPLGIRFAVALDGPHVFIRIGALLSGPGPRS